MTVIAYQGISGSFSEKATQYIIETNNIFDASVLPCVTSLGVLEALINSQASLGVLAFYNSTAGDVIETRDALSAIKYEILAETSIKIEHCLFSLTKIDPYKITSVHSHRQALLQCSKTLGNLLPNVVLYEEKDTATAAENLCLGKYGMNAAVICSKLAGLSRGLFLVNESINDNANNYTTFKLIRLTADL